MNILGNLMVLSFRPFQMTVLQIWNIQIFQILALTLSAIDLVDIKELKVREPLMDLESKADRKTSVASSQCIRITAAARRPQQSAHIWHIESLRSTKLTSEPQTFPREREKERG